MDQMEIPFPAHRERQEGSPPPFQDPLALLRSLPEPPLECQVCVVGAGPAGLMLAANLTRYGINVEVIDDRADQTPVGSRWPSAKDDRNLPTNATIRYFAKTRCSCLRYRILA
ncbi:hypothetical protein LB505_002806 [Fusarium chuoi]|nr:hypothetical protein LB505_002806 [Fusarium chuoi]